MSIFRYAMNKIAKEVKEKKHRDTNVVSDFASGIDPTGVATFKAATRNKKNHRMHRAVGTVGGFIGGSALGMALPAAAYAGVALATRGKSKKLSKVFRKASKDTMTIFNPRKMSQNIKGLKPSVNYVAGLTKAKDVLKENANMNDINKALSSGRAASKIENKYSTMIKNKVIPKYNKNTANDAKKMYGASKDVYKAYKGTNINEIGKHIDKVNADEAKVNKIFKTKDATGAATRSITAATGVAAGIGSGVLNASSAHSQYTAALNNRGIDINGKPLKDKKKNKR